MVQSRRIPVARSSSTWRHPREDLWLHDDASGEVDARIVRDRIGFALTDGGGRGLGTFDTLRFAQLCVETRHRGAGPAQR